MTKHGSSPAGSGAASFADAVASAGGRHPIDVFTALQGEQGPDAERLASEAATSAPATANLPQGDGLALPHPSDAEWRFEDSTAEVLLERAVELTRRGDAILLLGVPTVVLAALRSDADRRFVLACEDNVIGAVLRAKVATDSRFVGGAPDGCAAAILDPPWYPKLFDALIAYAGAKCRDEGWILAAAPSPGVRPGADEERATTIANASSAGLTFIEGQADALVYRTPAFELAAMRAAGVVAWLPCWRRGDLLTLRKTARGETPVVPKPRPAFELTLNGVRLRLITGPTKPAATLSPIVGGEVFPSVSARAHGREQANFWTTNNRAFECDPEATLRAMLAVASQLGLWPKGLDPEGISSGDSPPVDWIPLVDELSRIAARDLAEAAMLCGVSSWDRSVNDARFLNGSSHAFLQALHGVAA